MKFKPCDQWWKNYLTALLFKKIFIMPIGRQMAGYIRGHRLRLQTWNGKQASLVTGKMRQEVGWECQAAVMRQVGFLACRLS